MHSDGICGILQARVFPTMEIYDGDIIYTHNVEFYIVTNRELLCSGQ